MSSTFGRHFLRHIELYLTAAGLAVVVTVPQFFAADARVAAVAVTATAVGVVHGLLFWLVRRRQRLLREELIRDLQLMLKDRINNKLQLVLLHAGSEPAAMGDDSRQRLTEVNAAVGEISGLLEMLSLESLQRWQRRYAHLNALKDRT